MEKSKRGARRTQVTKLCDELAELLKQVKASKKGEKDQYEIESKLVASLAKLKNAHENLKEADKLVGPTVQNAEMEAECTAVLEYEDKAVEMIAYVEHALKTLTMKEAPKEERSKETHSEYINLHSGVQLKPFQMKKFDGKIENWLPFWEQFKLAVHENEQLSIAAKFNYLSESLVGKAEATIAGFSPTEKCYNEAIELLMEEYGNKEKIIEKLVQKLINLKPVHSRSDANGIRVLYNEAVSTVRNLSSFEIKTTEYEIMVKSILMKCIPAAMRIEYHKTNDKQEQSLQLLLGFIKKEIEALELSRIHENEKGISEKREYKPKLSTASALQVNTNNKDYRSYCIFCKRDNHFTANCKANIDMATKKSILKKEGRCYRCTAKNHNSRFCKNKFIKCVICKERHVTSMCERKENARRENRNRESDNNTVASVDVSREDTNNALAEAATTLSVSGMKRKEILLQTAKALVKNEENDNQIFTRIIMDNGSQRTFITEKLKIKLNLRVIKREKMNIVSFGKEKPMQTNDCEIVKLALKSQYNNNEVNIEAIVIPEICVDNIPYAKMKTQLSNNIKFELADNWIANNKLITGINILIGQDFYWKFNTGIIKKLEENLVAVKTFFGWTIQGQTKEKENNAVILVNVVEVERKDMIEISDFWNLESIGIKTDEVRNEDLYKKTMNSIKFDKGRYVVELPWKENIESLNNNKNVALKRLNNLTHKLMKNEGQLLNYDKEIRELVNSGIAERVVKEQGSPIYYMPHKPVYRDNKLTSKIRVVFDASSSEVGHTSLNEHLSPVENMVNDLVTTLLRFRSNRIAMVADIEKAFLQIMIAPKDRDSHRFVWYESLPKTNRRLPKITELRMTRVTFGITSSPFLLSATIQYHLNKYQQQYDEICKKLKQSFYVDDMILSVNTFEEANKIYIVSKKIMAEGGFNLRKWNTNDEILAEKIKHSGETIEDKVLGLRWRTESDVLSVGLANHIEYLQGLKPTKRNVMKAMAKIYDPLGFLGPFTVRVKLILQEIWKENVEWDNVLKGETLNSFQKWQNELAVLTEFWIPRCISTCKQSKMELHIFADASPKAFGAVAYVRRTDNDGITTTIFVCSKNRASPMKQTVNEITLPKLELTAALIAARLAKFLKKALDFTVNSITLWTDSTIALNWIKGNGKQTKPYVKARVSEINKLTNIYDWRYCNGKDNPADLLTRGIRAFELVNSRCWLYGPEWLIEDESNWPELIVENVVNMLTKTVEIEKPKPNESIIEIERFSNLSRLLRATSYVFRFLRNIKEKRKRTISKTIQPLTSEEVKNAEQYLVKMEQQRYYHEEIHALQSKRKLPVNSKIATLSPSVIDGLLKANCRLPSEYYEELRNPIILSKQSYLSELLVRKAHNETHHGGVSIILTRIRKKYWIVQARQLINRVLKRCIICIRLHGKSAMQPWTVLPSFRVKANRPFETTGIDFAGPLYVTSEIKEGNRKVYIMLFTCATVRAIHLELVYDMTTESCMNALRKFIARRGLPSLIISDNAKTFKRANLELKKLEELLKTAEIQNMAANKSISWKYIPERAAWWGGFWERLVRTVKNCLKAAIGKSIITADELATLLTEVENTVNSRPITYVTSSHNDLEALTPSHFLNTNCILSISDFKNDGTALAKSWILRQSIIKSFWKRWRNEYLCQLRTIHHNNEKLSKAVKVGDVVLVHEDNKPKLLWRLAVVQQIYPGRDGRVRACDIRLQNNQILKRPIQLLYPLEISSAGAEDVEN